MGLSISTTPARLQIETLPTRLEWKTKDATLDVKQKQPLINIKTEQPVVMIDQYQCFAEAGLKNNADFASEQAQKGYQKLMKFIAKEAQDGDSMARIGHKANIMINIAKNAAVTKREFGIGMMPRSRPKIDVKGGTVTIEAAQRNGIGEINGVTSGYKGGDISHNYTAGKVNITMASYGSINIRYTGDNLDSYI